MVCRAMIVALWLFMVVIMSMFVIVFSVVVMSVSCGIVWLCCLGTHGKSSCYLKA
jgi:hypothetical protein